MGVESDKLIVQFMWKCKEWRITETPLRTTKLFAHLCLPLGRRDQVSLSPTAKRGSAGTAHLEHAHWSPLCCRRWWRDSGACQWGTYTFGRFQGPNTLKLSLGSSLEKLRQLGGILKHLRMPLADLFRRPVPGAGGADEKVAGTRDLELSSASPPRGCVSERTLCVTALIKPSPPASLVVPEAHTQ